VLVLTQPTSYAVRTNGFIDELRFINSTSIAFPIVPQPFIAAGIGYTLSQMDRFQKIAIDMFFRRLG